MDFECILELNALRRSINLPAYLVFDLEVRRFNFFCMKQSNFCMEQSVFDYGVNWLFDYRAHLQFNSNTVAFFATKFVIGFQALQSGFFNGTKAGRFNSAFN